MSAASRRLPTATEIIAILAIICGVASAVTSWWLRGSFWEDEIIAVTHVLQPLPSFFVHMLRNDIHPFFYFLLLKFWSLVYLESDAWVLASSLVAALGSAVAIATVAYRVAGRSAAIWAVAFFCVLPSFSSSASNLRMYGLMPAIAVGCWYANREALRQGGTRWILAVILLQTIQSYTHAIGFFFTAFFALGALIGQREATTRGRFVNWLRAQVVSLVFMLPVVGSALVRGTEPLGEPTLWSLFGYLAQLVSIPAPAAWTLILGILAFLALVAFALPDREARTLVLVIPFGALLACTLASVVGKPMFKAPVFVASLVPFLVLAAGLGLARQPRLRPFAALFAILLSGALWSGQMERQLPENYMPAARYVVEHARPGDQVIVPSISVFWGVMRYGVGARWGEPLTIMPLRDNPQWTALKARLGPRLVAWLGLVPLADHVIHGGVTYSVGTHITKDIPPCSRVWVVRRISYEQRGQENIAFPVPMRQASPISFGDELTVSLMTPASCSEVEAPA